MYATISPRDRVAGLISESNGHVQLLDSNGAVLGSLPADAYYSRFPDTMVVDVQDAIQAVHELTRRSSMCLCLDMTLLLFDQDVSIATRRELAGELELLLKDHASHDYVLDILLSKPLPASADTDGATLATAGAKVARDFVHLILQSQERVSLVFNSWLAIIDDALVRQAGREDVFALFLRHGIFRRLATEAVDRAELDAIAASLAMDRGLSAQLDTAARIVTCLIREVRERLPQATAPRCQYD
jgi:hypothetical protein